MPNSSEYPRVLVIDPAPFNRSRNNGIVKSNLFQGWPKEKLAQIDYSNIQPSFDVCARYWKLRKTDIIKALFGFGYTAEMLARGNASEGTPGSSLGSEYDDRPLIERLLSSLPADIRLIISESIFRMPSLLSKSLRSWIEDFGPEVIYSITATAPMLLTVAKVSKWRNIPLIPYFTDDWISSLYKGAFLGGLLRRSMRHWFGECLNRSPIRLTPCEAMNEEYTKRYGGIFTTVMYPVERTGIPSPKPVRDSVYPIRFVYIGSLEPKRWRSLRAVGEALFKLRAAGIHGELFIYTYADEILKHHNDLTLEPVLRIKGTATPDDIPRLQQEADILVHAESFDPESRIYTKYSLSTKIPQYLMAGACIFAYGPSELASIRYVKDLDAGLVVSDEAESTLLCALRTLILDTGLRRRFGDNARRAGIQRHDAEAQRKRFREIIMVAAEKWASNEPV